jgi:hypothetical protein
MRSPILALLVLCLGGLVAALVAGPLNPPPGPVSSTYKTLAEIEPRTPVQSLPGSASAQYLVSAPGSYYLTGPITGVPGKSGIEIAASNVTLDLRGFTLAGVSGAIDGVRVTQAVSGLTIGHGAARAWPAIAFNVVQAPGSVLRDLRADNSDSGILAGASTQILGCIAQNNMLAGIAAGTNCLFADCLAQSNHTDGYYLSDGATAERCAAIANGSDGFYLDGDACTVRNSIARSNSGGGVVAIYSCTVDGVTAEYNSISGISAAGAARILNCTAHANNQGGISVADDSSVSRCRVDSNTLFGIKARSRCVVDSNLCSDSHGFGQGPGAAIYCTGPSNRVDSNTLSTSDVGLKADGASNLIVRNDLIGNTVALDLVPGQAAGSIVSTPSADPWANIQH